MILEVYKITNKQNGKIYIGITNQGVDVRWCKHCSDARHDSNFPIHNAIRKYGESNFQIEQIEVVEDVEVLKEREVYWIKEYNSYDREKGYNLTLGGDGTFGRYHSDETKDKIRQKALHRKRSEYSIHKQKETLKTLVYNHEDMSSRAKKGNVIRWSDPNNKTKQSKNSPNNRSILQYTLLMKFVKEFYNVSEAARSLNKTHGNIASCARGKIKTAYGFIWKYKE
jgi:group I intron endonuclease